jgi:uncharacterized protein YcbK (DUF882 family)
MPLYHIHTHKNIRLRLYDRRGRLRPAAIKRFSRFMESYRTGRVRPIHWRIPVILYDVWLHFGQPQVTVFSGYRPRSVVRLKTSKHVTGEAVDFALDGVSNSDVRDYLLDHWFMVGVGYYPNSYHVHLDVRKKKTFWIDYGGPGESAMYARRPYKDLKKGVAKRGHVPARFRPKKSPKTPKAKKPKAKKPKAKKPKAKKPKAKKPEAKKPKPKKAKPEMNRQAKNADAKRVEAEKSEAEDAGAGKPRGYAGTGE